MRDGTEAGKSWADLSEKSGAEAEEDREAAVADGAALADMAAYRLAVLAVVGDEVGAGEMVNRWVERTKRLVRGRLISSARDSRRRVGKGSR